MSIKSVINLPGGIQARREFNTGVEAFVEFRLLQVASSFGELLINYILKEKKPKEELDMDEEHPRLDTEFPMVNREDVFFYYISNKLLNLQDQVRTSIEILDSSYKKKEISSIYYQQSIKSITIVKNQLKALCKSLKDVETNKAEVQDLVFDMLMEMKIVEVNK